MTVWSAKKSDVTRCFVSSNATALAPFSQNSKNSLCLRIRPRASGTIEPVRLVHVVQRPAALEDDALVPSALARSPAGHPSRRLANRRARTAEAPRLSNRQPTSLLLHRPCLKSSSLHSLRTAAFAANYVKSNDTRHGHFLWIALICASLHFFIVADDAVLSQADRTSTGNVRTAIPPSALATSPRPAQ